jgi:hypothetical protein
MRRDFTHLRRWRNSVEQAETLTVKMIITAIVSGIIGAMILGVKVHFGK